MSASMPSQARSYLPRYEFPCVEKLFLNEVTYHSQMRRSPTETRKRRRYQGISHVGTSAPSTIWEDLCMHVHGTQ